MEQEKVIQIQYLIGHQDRVWQIKWHPKLNVFASCSADKTIRIWGQNDQNKYALQCVIDEQHEKTIRSIAWNPDGNLLASSSFDGTICIWKIFYQNKKIEYEFFTKLEGHENEVKLIDWNYNGKYLASCSRDKTVWVWEYDPSQEDNEFSCCTILNGHTQDVKCVKFKPNSNTLFSSSFDDTIKVWFRDIENDNWVDGKTLLGHQSIVWQVDINKQGNLMVSVSEDQTIKLWYLELDDIEDADQDDDFENQKIFQIQTLSNFHDRPIYSCSFNTDSNLLATVGGDNKLNLFKIEQLDTNETMGQNILATIFEQKEQVHESDINCVQFHPNENILLTCGDDNLIRIFKINDLMID